MGRFANKKTLFFFFILILLLFGVWLATKGKEKKSDNSNSASQAQPESAKTLKGVSLSPKSYSGSDFTEFLTKTKEVGSLVSWAGDWALLPSKSASASVVVILSQQFKYSPVIIVGFSSQQNGKLVLNHPYTDANRAAFKKDIVDFATNYKPPYLGIGNEVNLVSDNDSVDFAKFVEDFSSTYDSVKKVSPDTKIFTVFQLEHLKGLKGGLFGGTSDTSKSEWSLLAQFPKADLVAFTSYPGLIYKDPSAIPSNYYSEIKSHTNKPIAFTEIGWGSDAKIPGWESSEEEQASFVSRFFALNKENNTSFVIWPFLYDQKTIEPFVSMGLITQSGKEKKALGVWKSE